MPCMGPDLEAARKRGQEVGKKILDELIKQHNLWDITNKSKHEFIQAVEELFVEDACNGF